MATTELPPRPLRTGFTPPEQAPVFGAERRSDARRDRRGTHSTDRRGSGAPDPRGVGAAERRAPIDRRGKPTRRNEPVGVFAVDVPRYATRMTPVLDTILVLFCLIPLLALLLVGLT